MLGLYVQLQIISRCTLIPTVTLRGYNLVELAAVLSHSVALAVADLLCKEKGLVGLGGPTWGTSSSLRVAAPVTTLPLPPECTVSKSLTGSARHC